ncbi:hypothetical protein BFX40_20475 [Mesorhizobium sp. SEMIA 3007]|nr:hypothetical protein BFX40_20475 [Mesorhizobium sp. SEMIA 3007]
MDGRYDLLMLRLGMGATQAQMAKAMGVPLRTYEDLEGGRSKIRPIHMKAAAFAAIVNAVEAIGYESLPVEIAGIVRQAAK